jgi:hypothetical protein
MDYEMIVGSSLVSIGTPLEVEQVYNTSMLDLVKCQNVDGQTVQSWLSRIPDNRGKMVANYSLLTRTLGAMAGTQQ